MLMFGNTEYCKNVYYPLLIYNFNISQPKVHTQKMLLMDIDKLILHFYEIRIAKTILTKKNKRFYSDKLKDKKFKTLKLFFLLQNLHMQEFGVHLMSVKKRYTFH